VDMSTFVLETQLHLSSFLLCSAQPILYMYQVRVETLNPKPYPQSNMILPGIPLGYILIVQNKIRRRVVYTSQMEEYKVFSCK